MNKIYILEKDICEEIFSDMKKSEYHIHMEYFQKQLRASEENSINKAWVSHVEKNKNIATDDVTFFFRRYEKGAGRDYVFADHFRYAYCYGKCNEFQKHAMIAISQDLTALSSMCIVCTSDNKIVLGVKTNMDNKISGFSGYLANKYCVNDEIDIYRYLCDTMKREINIDNDCITSIKRIGQTYAPFIMDKRGRQNTRIFNNDYIIYLNVSFEEVAHRFTINEQFSTLIEVNSESIDEFISKNENNMSIHCVAALFLLCRNVKVQTNEYSIIDVAENKIGNSSVYDLLKSCQIYAWGLIGNSQINKYSFAPEMWNKLYDRLRYPIGYFIINSDIELEVDSRLCEIQNKSTVIGFNVAMPWKNKYRKYCDYFMKEGYSNCEPANTIVYSNVNNFGCNTDGIGLLNGIINVCGIRNKTILILGAGGAAQTVPSCLFSAGAGTIYITDIYDEKAKRLVESYHTTGRGDPLKIKCIENMKISQAIRKADIIINCTPCGMYGNDDMPISSDDIMLSSPDTVFVECIYNPPITPLLREAEKQGRKIVKGTEMLIFQAAESFGIAFDERLEECEFEQMRIDLAEIGRRQRFLPKTPN